MKKINNKGFTLIEMIIAMTILGIVISLGYGIFNSSQKSLNEQSEVFNSQTTMNLVNTFMNKDLEQAKSISKPLNNSNIELNESDFQHYVNSVTSINPIQYTYLLDLGSNKTIKYVVKIELDKKGDYIYYITRIDENGGSIELLSNQTIYNGTNIEIPCIIKLENQIYDIQLGYKHKKKQNIYRFSVKSRIDI